MKVLCFCVLFPYIATERWSKPHSSDTLSTDAFAKIAPSDVVKGSSSDLVPIDEGGSLAKIYKWWKSIHFRHTCRNCQALIDYEWVLEEYGNTWIIKALMIVMIVVLIWLLGTTAADFFVPPLLYISNKLNLSQEIAGATILALGNGAPDIFAVVTAGTKGDLPLSVSEMLGSNMFTLCITGGFILFLWSRVRPEENEEDFSIDDDATTPNVDAPGADKEVGRPTVNIYQAVYMKEKAEGFGKRMLYTLAIYMLTLAMVAMVLMYGTHSIWKVCFLPPIYFLYLFMLWTLSDSPSSELKEGVGASHSSSCDEDAGGEEAGNEPEPLAGLAKPKDASILQTTSWILKYPTYIVRWICIPPVNGYWSQQHRLFSSIAPTAMLVFCWLTNTGNMQELTLYPILGFSALALAISTAIFICSSSEPVLPWFYPLLSLVALISAILWLAVLAAEITAVLEAIGYAMRIPRLRLGFTAIAWGNSLGDLLVCVATVRKGHAGMAIAAIFAAPLIDDLIALGISFGMIAYNEGSIPVMCGESCPKELRGPLIVSLVYVAVAVTMLASMFRCRGRWKSLVWACALAALYVSFLIVILFVLQVDAPPAKQVK